ncbi:MAG: L-threonylcarbamoyladenylate synthase [Solirubrobacterales bacterium]
MPTTTRILPIDPHRPDPSALEEAARVLKRGGLVAFATETVYGLGADATDPGAVARIFEAKGRPSFNPLIVHVGDTTMARACVEAWPDRARVLADAFWPGPLTLVLRRSTCIPDVVTAGRDTVGVRIPGPAVARRLIERAGRPIAAPSANRSNGISPTLARHVLEDLDGRIDLVLDSGPTTVGLESTVVDLTSADPTILRPGPVTPSEIERAMGVRVVSSGGPGTDPGGPRTSPGQLAIHYAPRTRALRVEDAGALEGFSWPRRSALVVVGGHDLADPPALIRRFDLETPEEAARDLYRVLHECDALSVEVVVVVLPPDNPEWLAVRDRLGRATLPAR